jgi:hypothetical protein
LWKKGLGFSVKVGIEVKRKGEKMGWSFTEDNTTGVGEKDKKEWDVQ